MTLIAQQKPSSLRQGVRWPIALVLLLAGLPLLVSLGLLLAGLLLMGRRLSGAFDQALPAAGLGLAGIALAGGSEFLRRRLTSDPGMFWFPKGNWRFVPCYSLGWLPVFSAWLTAVAISLPGSSPLGLAGLWSCLLLGGVWAGRQQWRWFARPGFFLADSVTVNGPEQKRGQESFAEKSPDPFCAADGDELSSDEEPSPDVVQQWVRRRDPAGDEWVTGMVHVAVEPGQKTVHAHVAFCPPFLTAPACEAELMSGPEAELKVGQVLSQGARFDVRLAECPREPIDLLVEFAAHWQPREKQAGP